MRRPRLHGAPGAAEPAALGLLRGPGRARGSRPRGVGSGRGRGWGGRAAARNGVRTAGTVVAAAGGARARAGNRQGSGVSRSRCGDRCQGNRLRLFAGLAAPPPRRSHNPPPTPGLRRRGHAGPSLLPPRQTPGPLLIAQTRRLATAGGLRRGRCGEDSLCLGSAVRERVGDRATPYSSPGLSFPFWPQSVGLT